MMNSLSFKRITGGIAKVRDIKAFRILMYVSLPFFPAFCLLIMDYMNFGGYFYLVVEFAQKFTKPYFFELTAVFFIFAVLFLIFKKAVISGGILGVLSVVCAYVNYMKVATNGDNFFPRDIALIGNAGNLMSFVSGDLPKYFWPAAAALILWIFAFWFFRVQVPLGWFIRLPAAAALVSAAAIMFSSSARSEDVLNKFSMSFVDTALQSSNYEANGFLGAFIVNILSMNVDKPDGYSRTEIDAILEGYTETPSVNAELFDVIVVLSESFFDARILDGVEFGKNPLENYDELLQRPGCYSGMVYTTALNGGTVKPEFDILTGLTTDYLPSGTVPYEYVSGDMRTYVRNYKEAGYRTIALHPYDKKFYSRSSAYGHIGFDEFYGLDEISEIVEAEYKRGYCTDESLLEAMKLYLDGSGAPTFMFAITMQNHQPFKAVSDIQIPVSSGVLEETVLDSVTTYTQGLYDADKMLGELAEYIDSREKPTVMLFFGDHLPNLGNNFAAFESSGLFSAEGGFSKEELRIMYSTPFVVYSNRELPPGMFSGNTGNEISTYHLLNAVAVSTGFRQTPYMNLLADFYSAVPYYNVRLGLEQTDETEKYTRAMKYITYDRLLGDNYSFDR